MQWYRSLKSTGDPTSSKYLRLLESVLCTLEETNSWPTRQVISFLKDLEIIFKPGLMLWNLTKYSVCSQFEDNWCYRSLIVTWRMGQTESFLWGIEFTGPQKVLASGVSCSEDPQWDPLFFFCLFRNNWEKRCKSFMFHLSAWTYVQICEQFSSWYFEGSDEFICIRSSLI